MKMKEEEFKKRLEEYYKTAKYPSDYDPEKELFPKCDICGLVSEYLGKDMDYSPDLRMWLCNLHAIEFYLCPEALLEEKDPLHQEVVSAGYDPELIYEILKRTRDFEHFSRRFFHIVVE